MKRVQIYGAILGVLLSLAFSCHSALAESALPQASEYIAAASAGGSEKQEFTTSPSPPTSFSRISRCGEEAEVIPFHNVQKLTSLVAQGLTA